MRRTIRRRNGSRRSATCTCSTRAGTSCAKQIFANQKKLGVIPQDAKLTPWPEDLLKEWDQLTADEKKMFIRQVDVFAAYLAYTDHEIGRVIQAVEDMGKLDNTLIIYISGDNGNSAEGTLIGTPNEVAMFNGVEVPVADQLKYFYDVWGSDKTYNHMAVPWTWAFDTPFSWTKQIASHFGGVAPGHGDLVAEGDQGQGRHPPPVPPRHRHRADDPRSDRHPRAGLVDGIQQKPIEGVSMVYTFDKKNANAPSTHKTQYFEMMGDHAIYHDGWIASTKVMRPPWDVLRRCEGEIPPTFPANCTISPRTGRRPRTSRPSTGEAQGDGGPVLEEAAKYQVLPLDASVATRLVTPRPSLTAGRNEFTCTGELTGTPERRRAEPPQRLVQLQGRDRDSEGRRRRHDRDPGRAVRRLRLLPAQGQAGVPLEFGRSEARALGRSRRARARQAHARVRLQI